MTRPIPQPKIVESSRAGESVVASTGVFAGASSKEKGLTRQQAINLMCRQCIYDSAGCCGNVAQQTTLCSNFDCPLWDWRPVSRSPLPESALMVLVHHDLDPPDWPNDPANFYTRPEWRRKDGKGV